MSRATTEDLARRNALVRFERIDPAGPTLHEPKRQGDVGWDLEAATDAEIKPGESVDIATNIRLELPDGVWATIRARSSIVRRGLQVEAGIIDTGYRGPLFVLTRNLCTLSPLDLLNEPAADGGFGADGHWHKTRQQMEKWIEDHTVTIQRGERIGQVIFHRVTPVWATETEVVSKATQRGVEGFGSTGA